MSLEATLAAIVTALLACGFDLRTRRLPNALTFGSAAAAFVFWLAADGLSGAGQALVGWAAGCAIFLPFFLLRGMGAGDVKLLAALGAWLGPALVFWTALYGALAGGVLALAVAFAHGYLRRAIGNIGFVLWYWRMAGPSPVPGLTLTDAQGPRLPYALPIFIGMLAALWLQ